MEPADDMFCWQPKPSTPIEGKQIMQQFALNWTSFEAVAPERVTEGQPTTRLAQGVDNHSFTSGLWEVTPGRFTTAPVGFDEVIHILKGRGVLRSADGNSVDLAPGVSFVMEDGFVGEWEIQERLQKFYTKIKSPPSVDRSQQTRCPPR